MTFALVLRFTAGRLLIGWLLAGEVKLEVLLIKGEFWWEDWDCEVWLVEPIDEGLSGLDEGACWGRGLMRGSLTFGLGVSGIVDGRLLASELGVRAGLMGKVPTCLICWF